MEYAIFKTGGKQYRVKPGDTLDVELLTQEVNGVAEFGEVLAVSDGGEVTFGFPFIPGARVLAQVQSHYKDRKIIVYKYKAKTRYRRKKSHRQTYTRLLIQDIQLKAATASAARKRSRKKPAAASKDKE
ncbi:MAG TPA: 50S ribosomal protein L21 [Dehalococcoidia bacterium]|jgi:large subunit ribosomal protein L21|nr:50S ribosomal protein L21 [Dehalococcoidia bacterium]|tara:strand:- start:545 stop:931 length:387 start_codon:yes stop_codon:yes gene_type:complete